MLASPKKSPASDERGQAAEEEESQRISTGSITGLGVGAILANDGKRRSLRGLVRHGPTESDLVARDG
jgi:hypothetical protein